RGLRGNAVARCGAEHEGRAGDDHAPQQPPADRQPQWPLHVHVHVGSPLYVRLRHTSDASARRAPPHHPWASPRAPVSDTPGAGPGGPGPPSFRAPPGAADSNGVLPCPLHSCPPVPPRPPRPPRRSRWTSPAWAHRPVTVTSSPGCPPSRRTSSASPPTPGPLTRVGSPSSPSEIGRAHV